MFAERVRTKAALAAASVAAIVAVGYHLSKPATRPTTLSEIISPCNFTPLPSVFVHVKWRSHRAAASVHAQQVVGGLRAEPVFSIAADHDDPRSRWTRIEVSQSFADSLVRDLERDPDVEHAFVEPETVLATSEIPPTPTRMSSGPDADRDLVGTLRSSTRVEQALDEMAASLTPPNLVDGDACPITTPSFESYQGYLGPAPHGIDAPAAWRRGHRGAGVWWLAPGNTATMPVNNTHKLHERSNRHSSSTPAIRRFVASSRG